MVIRKAVCFLKLSEQDAVLTVDLDLAILASIVKRIVAYATKIWTLMIEADKFCHKDVQAAGLSLADTRLKTLQPGEIGRLTTTRVRTPQRHIVSQPRCRLFRLPCQLLLVIR